MSQMKTNIQIPLTKVFKRIFNQSSHANRVLLTDFINTVLKKSLSSPVAEIIDTQKEDDYRPRSPETCLNLKMKSLSDRVVEVQIQLHPEAFYRSQIDEHTLIKAHRVSTADVHNRYQINLLNFNLLQESSHYHNLYPANTSNARSFREIHYLELSKFKIENPKSPLERWLYFIVHVGRPDQTERFQQLIHEDPYFKLAETLYRRNGSVKNYPVIVKEEQLNLSKWVEESRFIEKERIAIKMIKEGFPYQQIVELTNIGLEELDHLVLTIPLLSKTNG